MTKDKQILTKGWIIEMTMPLGIFASKESAQVALDSAIKTARIKFKE